MSKKILQRGLLFVLGMLLMSIGIVLVTKSNLGTSPISTIPYVMSMISPMSFGVLTLIVSMVFILIEIAILGRAFPKFQYTQILVGPLFGLFIDLSMFLFDFTPPSNYFLKGFALVGGCAVIALGIFLQVKANFIINPGEGLVKVISRKLNKQFGTVKMAFDWTLVIIATLISLIAFHSINGIGIGTVVSAFSVGYFIKLFVSIVAKKGQSLA